MTFGKFMAGVLLIGGIAYLGYLMDVPMMVIAGLSVVLLIVCLMSGL
jgi:hypothetical protein